MSKSVKKSGALNELEGVSQPGSISSKAAEKVKQSRKKVHFTG